MAGAGMAEVGGWGEINGDGGGEINGDGGGEINWDGGGGLNYLPDPRNRCYHRSQQKTTCNGKWGHH